MHAVECCVWVKQGKQKQQQFFWQKTPVKLTTVIHQGHLLYRIPVTGKRIS
jgi:hypothetical protein